MHKSIERSWFDGSFLVEPAWNDHQATHTEKATLYSDYTEILFYGRAAFPAIITT